MKRLKSENYTNKSWRLREITYQDLVGNNMFFFLFFRSWMVSNCAIHSRKSPWPLAPASPALKLERAGGQRCEFSIPHQLFAPREYSHQNRSNLYIPVSIRNNQSQLTATLGSASTAMTNYVQSVVSRCFPIYLDAFAIAKRDCPTIGLNIYERLLMVGKRSKLVQRNFI